MARLSIRTALSILGLSVPAKTARAFLIALLLTLAIVPATADSIYSVFYDSRFGTIDDTTGAFTQIGTLPIAQSAGIAWDNGTLYAQSMQSELVSIDPLSGAASILGTSGLQLSSVGFAGGLNGLFEVDYQSNLYSINPNTGAASLVGATGLSANNGNWATSLSDSGTNLYFTAGGGDAIDELYEINTSTGVATDLGSTGVTNIAGSAIVSGYLDLFQYDAGTDHIYVAPLGSTDFTPGPVLSVQIVDGGTAIGAPPSESNNAPTAPEPFSFLLLGSGLIGLAVLSRLGCFAWRRVAANDTNCRASSGVTPMK